MIAVIPECYTNLAFGEFILKEWKYIYFHDKNQNIDRVIYKTKKLVENSKLKKCIIVIDKETGTQHEEIVEGFITYMKKIYNLEKREISSGIYLYLKDKQKPIIIVFDPNIEEAFIKKLDPDVLTNKKKYKGKKGYQAFIKKLEKYTSSEIEEIRRIVKNTYFDQA